jgi:hypothetical protein
VGQTTVAFTGAQVSGVGSGGVAADVAFDVVGGVGGIGVATGGSALVQSSANEFLRIDIERGTKFAVTLGDFGTIGALFEIVEFKFYLGSSPVATVLKSGCNLDGGLASFSIPVGTVFDRIEITPLPSSDGMSGTGITAFLVSEIRACEAAAATCETSLATLANTCP